MKKYHLYILRSLKQNRHYIGITGNLAARLVHHNSGDVRSTKPYKPWQIVYVEEYNDKTVARKREIFLKKTARARKELFEKLAKGPIV